MNKYFAKTAFVNWCTEALVMSEDPVKARRSAYIDMETVEVLTMEQFFKALQCYEELVRKDG